MRSFKAALAGFFLVGILVACTIERRVHRPGYHVEWKHRYRGHSTDAGQTFNENTVSPEVERHEITAASSVLTDSIPVRATLLKEETPSLTTPSVARRLTGSSTGTETTTVQAKKTVRKASPEVTRHNDRNSGIGVYQAYILLIVILILIGVVFLGLIVFGILALIMLENPLLGIILLSIAVAVILLMLLDALLEKHRKRHPKSSDGEKHEEQQLQPNGMTGFKHRQWSGAALKTAGFRKMVPQFVRKSMATHGGDAVLFIIPVLIILLFLALTGIGIWALITIPGSVLGIILLSVAAAMIIYPLIAILVTEISDNRYEKRRLEEEERKAGFTAQTIANVRKMVPQLVRKSRATRGSEVFAAILYILLILTFPTLVVVGIWALITLASPALGIILLSIAAAMILVPLMAIRVTETKDNRREQGRLEEEERKSQQQK